MRHGLSLLMKVRYKTHDKRSKGVFACVEGIDFVGKTTTCRLAAERLIRKGYSVQHVHFPINKPDLTLDHKTLINIFLTEMLDEKGRLEEKLNCGMTIFVDRYFYSTLAYQGKTDDDMAYIIEMIKSYNLLVPDIVFLIDADPSILLSRMRDEKRDTFESNLRFQAEVRERFLELYKQRPFGARWLKLDGLGKLGENIKLTVSRLLQLMRRPGFEPGS